MKYLLIILALFLSTVAMDWTLVKYLDFWGFIFATIISIAMCFVIIKLDCLEEKIIVQPAEVQDVTQ